MSSYLEKLKNAISKKEGIQVSQAQVQRLRAGYQDISTIAVRLRAMESWKERDADPIMGKNLKDIVENIKKLENIKIEITTIHDKIIAARDEIKALPAKIENHLNTVVVPDILGRAKAEIKGFVDRNVMPPFLKMKDTFLSVGNGVKNEIEIVANQGKKLSENIANEMENIKNKFVTFGTEIKTKATALGSGVKGVSTAMSDMVKETKPALDAAISWGRKKASIITLSKVIARLTFDGGKVAKKANQGAVIPEIIEGLGDISRKFGVLKTQFDGFGNTIKAKSANIGFQLETTGKNIDANMDAFLDNFKVMFANMAARIKGGTGQVVKAINIVNEQAKVELAVPVKLPPPLPARPAPVAAKPRVPTATPAQREAARREAARKRAPPKPPPRPPPRAPRPRPRPRPAPPSAAQRRAAAQAAKRRAAQEKARKKAARKAARRRPPPRKPTPRRAPPRVSRRRQRIARG